jgi:phage-related protein
LINGVDASTVGFRLSAAPGWMDAPKRTHPQAVRPRRVGAMLSGTPSEAPLIVSLQGIVDGASDTVQRSNEDALVQLILRTQPAQLVFPDSATRYVSGYLDSFVTDAGAGPSMIQRTLKERIDFLLLDPYAYDLAVTTTTLDATIRRLQLGTAPSFPVITLNGALVNPVINFYKYDGTLLCTMGLTITNIAGDVLIIDMDAVTITKNGATAIATLTAGDFFSMDPMAAQLGLGVAAGDRPYITVNSGAGTSAFRRAWR